MQARTALSQGWKLITGRPVYWLIIFCVSALPMLVQSILPLLWRDQLQTQIANTILNADESLFNPALFLSLFGITLVFSGLYWLFFTSGRVAVIDGMGETLRHDRRQPAQSLIRNGIRLLPKIFVLDLILTLPLLILYGLMVFWMVAFVGDINAAIVNGDMAPGGFFGIFCFTCGIILVAIPIGILEAFSVQAAVIDRLPVGQSIRSGWRFLGANTSVTIRLAMLLFGCLIIVMVLLGIFMIPLSLLQIGPLQEAGIVCGEQSTDPEEYMRCVSAFQLSPRYLAMQAGFSLIQLVPLSFISTLGVGSIVALYCGLSMPPSADSADFEDASGFTDSQPHTAI